MKVVILAGGHGSRLAEETAVRPKPMVEIGGIPMLWHIMKMFGNYGLKDFVIALGYKGEFIKGYFENFVKNHSHVRVDFRSGEVRYTDYQQLDWSVDLVDTGQTTFTGGRVKRVAPFLDNQPFVCAYGDGLTDLDFGALVKFHRAHGKLATLTAVRPPARFGHVEFAGDQVKEFSEKPQTAEGWINGGFFVFARQAFAGVPDDPGVVLETDVLPPLAAKGELSAYHHAGFWQCMDTYREMLALNQLWARGDAPWLR